MADWCTIGGIFTSSMLRIGLGPLGLADVLLGLAAGGRVLQLTGTGLDFREIRRHGFVLSVLGLFTVGGVLSGVANGDPLAWDFLRIVIATVGTVLVVATYATSHERLVRLVRVLCLGGTVMAVSGLIMGHTGGRAVGLSIHPNGLGHSVLMATMGSIYLLEQAKDRRARLFWLGAIGVQLLAVMDSGSRGSLVGLAAGVLLYCLLSGDRRVVITAVLLAYAVGMVGYLGLVQLPENNPITRFANEGNGSDLDRQHQLDIALDKIRDDPFFGDGWENIILVHVVYLQGWVGAGALGMLALVTLGVAWAVWPFFQDRRRLALGCLLAAIAVTWLFTNALSLRDQWAFVAIALRMTASPLVLLGRRTAERLEPLPRATPAA